MLWGFGLLIAFGLGGAGYWWSLNKYEYIPKRWGVVVPGKIYRSGQLTPRVLDRQVRKHGITTIIDLQLNDIHDPNQQAEIRYAAEHHLKHVRFPLGGDGTGELTSYAGAVSLLIECERRNEPVLVHCAAGTQRTGGVVACYRLLVENADPREVIAELKAYEWKPQGDAVLLGYLNDRLPQLASVLVERGSLAEIPASIPHLSE